MKTMVLRLSLAGISVAALASNFFAPAAIAAFDYQGNFDKGLRTVVDREGNVYVAATCDSDSNGKDMVLIKYNSALDEPPIWSVPYDGPDHLDDSTSGLALDSAGNVFLAGTSHDSTSDDDIVVVGVDPDGDFLWSGDGAKRYDSGSNNVDTAGGVVVDSNGNIAVCGAGDGDAVIIVYEPNGNVKTGWPQTYDYYDGNESLKEIAVSSANHFAATGRRIPDEGPTEMLAVMYNGGGSLLQAYQEAYSSENAEGVDITYGKTDHISIAANVHDSTVSYGAIYHYTESSDGPIWIRVHGEQSHFTSVATNGDFVYGAGLEGIYALAIKLNVADGTYSSTWAAISMIDEQGTRTYRGTYDDGEYFNAVAGGNNLFLTGAGLNPNDDTPQDAHYLTVAYSKNGGLILDEFYPEDDPADDNYGFGVAVFGSGSIYATGQLEGNAYDAGTLLYSAGAGESDPTSSTIEVGSSGGGSYTDLASSNNGYQVVAADLFTSNPLIGLRVQGNLGSVPNVLSLRVESKASTTGVTQRLQIYNYEEAEYETIDTRLATTTDRILTVTIPGDPDPYVDGSYYVKFRILFDDTGVPIEEAWTASIDHAVWLTL